MLSFLSPLFTALGGGTGIGNLLSGVAGMVAANKSSKAQGIDYQKLRDDSSAAGFNPLTALLAGGGQGYQRQFSPDLSSGAFIGEAIGRGLDTFFNTPPAVDPLAKNLRAMNDFKTAQLAAAAASPTRRFGYALTDVQPFGTVEAASANSSVGSDSGSDPAGDAIVVAGVDVTQNRDWSPAQKAEDRWGDLGQAIYGLGVMGADVWATAKERSNVWAKQYGVQPFDRPKSRGVLFGKKPRLPVGYIGKLPSEVSTQEANILRYGQWGLPHFGPLSSLK